MAFSDLALSLGLGQGRGAKALAREVTREGRSLRVVALSDAVARALTLEGHTPIRSAFADARLPLRDGEADALCGSGLPISAADGHSVENALKVLADCTRVVKDGGRILLATPAGPLSARRGPASMAQVAALLLHAGLVDLEQRLAGATAITAGRVRR
jgi:SAM-dependent methyltransferase